jgi:hypothetical protein
MAGTNTVVAQGIRPLAHVDIPGGAQVVVSGGIAFVGHIKPPVGTTVIDIRDPRHPRILAQVKVRDDRSHAHKVMVAGDLMLVNSQRDRRKFFKRGERLTKVEAALTSDLGRSPSDAEVATEIGVKEKDVPVLRQALHEGYENGGFCLYDVADPANPKLISFQRTGGFGVHGFDFDGRYAYVSTEMDGFRGNILVNYDVSDPARPSEVSRWWLPGQAPGEDGPGGTGGRQIHHGLRCGDRFWAACWQAGIYVLDVSDLANPAVLGSYNYHPPFPEPTHTVMALPQKHEGRDLALVIDEEHDPHPKGQPHAALWVFDVTDPAAMKPISVFEVSERDSPWSRAGRFGASQFVEHPTGDKVFATWFAGGLRVVDIADPTCPREVAYYIPAPRMDFPAPESMDVEVDDRGVICLLDRNRGLDILELES